MRTGKTERKIDAMTEITAVDIEIAYDEAFTKAMRKNRETLKQMRAIMDGEQKPPRYCITEKQKERWKEKALMKLLNDSGIAESFAAEIASAGNKCVSNIKRFGLNVYETAYKGTMDQLKG